MSVLEWMAANDDLTIVLLIVLLIFVGIFGNFVVALVRAFKE